MSNYTKNIKHPITGEKVKANFLDDYFGKHEYGVFIVGSKDTDPVYREEEIEVLPDEVDEKNI
jgi:hypothetical protein